MNALATLSEASRLLTKARTLEDIHQIRDIATAARAYAKAAQLGIEATNKAAEIKIRAERRAGEMLAQLERGQGNRHTVEPEGRSASSEYKQTLEDTQTNERTARNWQQIARIPEPEFEQHIAETVSERQELTSAGVHRLAKRRSQPAAEWTDDELDRKALVEAGATVLANIKRDGALIEWARCQGIYERIDRHSIWGNPFLMGSDGTRDEVIESYKWYYGRKPSLWPKINSLSGKVLGCWCYPEPCHGDVLVETLGLGE